MDAQDAAMEAAAVAAVVRQAQKEAAEAASQDDMQLSNIDVDLALALGNTSASLIDAEADAVFVAADLDGDGKVTPQDMRFFYDVQTSRMESLGHDVVSFSDVLCQMSDMIKPGKVSEGGDQFLFFRFSFFLFFLLDFFVDSDDQLMLTEKQNKN